MQDKGPHEVPYPVRKKGQPELLGGKDEEGRVFRRQKNSHPQSPSKNLVVRAGNKQNRKPTQRKKTKANQNGGRG